MAQLISAGDRVEVGSGSSSRWSVCDPQPPDTGVAAHIEVCVRGRLAADAGALGEETPRSGRKREGVSRGELVLV